MMKILRRVKQSGVYFITTDTWQRRQLFLSPEPAGIVLEQILECRDRGCYRLHAFVLMPEHLHMLITPGVETSLERTLMMIKGGSSFRIRKELNFKFPIWQRGYHDRWIRDLQEYRIRKQYIDLNPLKAGLVETSQAYAFGSANGSFKVDESQYD
jgi:putative transposase